MTKEERLRKRLAAQQALTSEAVQLKGWTNVHGNSIELEYYTGVEADNPSGSTSNVKIIYYYKRSKLVIRKTLTYNADDNVLTITAG